MNKRGATVGEVVVLIVFFAIIAAVALPILTNRPCGARKAKCLNNLKQCAQALKMYADDYNGAMPSSYFARGSKSWNKRDALYFCTRRGKIPFEHSPRRTWAEALYDHMKSPDIVFCPSDTVDQQSPHARTSYWYKLANDKAWYGVGCEKPRRSMADYGYEADQIAFYERMGWHFGDDTNGVRDGIQINASYIDTHVETIVISNGTNGDSVNCAANANGEPMYYNTDVSKKTSQATVQKGPATLTDPTWCYDTL